MYCNLCVYIYIYKYEINFYFPLATGNYGQRLAALLGILYWWIVVRVTCELHLRDIKWYSLHTFNLHDQICGQGTIYIYKHILPPSTCQKRTHTQKKTMTIDKSSARSSCVCELVFHQTPTVSQPSKEELHDTWLGGNRLGSSMVKNNHESMVLHCYGFMLRKKEGWQMIWYDGW